MPSSTKKRIFYGKTINTVENDFYADSSAVTVNSYGKGKAYYVAFSNEGEFFADFIDDIAEKLNLEASPFKTPDGVSVVRRGDHLFVMNFADEEKVITLDREYADIVKGGTLSEITLPVCGYAILK